jgi:hypothetical protein
MAKGDKITLDTANIARYVWNGQGDRFWYAETRRELAEMLPVEDIDLLIDLLVATSITTSLKANVYQAFKALYQLKNDLPFEGYLPAIQYQLDLIKKGEEFKGRKIWNYAQALKGNRDAVVVDIWVVRAFGLEVQYYNENVSRQLQRSPSNRVYSAIQDYMTDNALKMRLQPRELQSMIWAGIRTERTGRANTTRYRDVVANRIRRSLFPVESPYVKDGYILTL